MLKKNNILVYSLIFFLLTFLSLNFTRSYTKAEDKNYASFKIEKIKKRNRPGCDRLGNVYGYCEWIAFLKVTNYTERKISYFCSVINIDNKNYELCFGKNDGKYIVKANKDKIFLLNLKKLISYPNKNSYPSIKLMSHRLSFIK